MNFWRVHECPLNSEVKTELVSTLTLCLFSQLNSDLGHNVAMSLSNTFHQAHACDVANYKSKTSNKGGEQSLCHQSALLYFVRPFLDINVM